MITDKAPLLCALYNNAFVNGYCHENGIAQTATEAGVDIFSELTIPEAERYIRDREGDFTKLDIRGRWLAVDLGASKPDFSSYQEHFGISAESLIKRLELTGSFSRIYG